MSTVKANNVQVGQSGTATNNFTLYQPSSPDGTVRLAVGNSGATSADVLTANSSGNVGIGTSSPTNIGAGYPHLEVNGSITGVISVSAGGVRGLSLSVDNSAANIQSRVSGQPLLFFTNGGAGATERMRITSGGNLLVGTTTNNASGGVIQVSNGITFPATQSASSDANTLDDYEEGTFTPTVLGSTTAGTGTYTYQVGTYVKVGQLVSVSCLIEITNHTGTGNLRFGNLPFATSNSNSLNRYGGAIGSLNNLALTASNYALLHAQNNSTEMLMLQYPVGGGGQTDVPMDTSFAISFTFTYRCSA